jgi:hypothetical protein
MLEVLCGMILSDRWCVGDEGDKIVRRGWSGCFRSFLWCIVSLDHCRLILLQIKTFSWDTLCEWDWLIDLGNSCRVSKLESSSTSFELTVSPILFLHYLCFSLILSWDVRIGVGFCGALTTFSTYSMDVIKFSQQGELGKAAAYVVASNLVGIGGAASGYKVARKIFR